MIRLRLLGETAIDVDGIPVGPESQVLFAVLLVLALERGKRIARAALHRLLWPDADERTGRHNLRQVAYKLRQLGVQLDASQSSLMLPAAAVGGELVELIAGGADVGRRLLAGRRLGELLPGYAPTFSSPFADWVDEQRGLLHAQLRRALLGATAEARAAGRWREVEAIAREVLRFDPLNEEATLALAEATALAGAKTQAIGLIDRYLAEVGKGPGDLRVQASVLRRRIAERFPAHKYVSAADRCFVGRATEMAELLAVWHLARERRGGAVLLWGEPGIGKTRLAHELARVAVLQGAQVQRVASRSWDVGRPLGAIVDLVPPMRELPGAAGIDPACNDYLDRLTRHDPSRALTELPDPAALHRQVRQAVFDLIDSLLAEAPLVLVLEDVQWLDPASWEVVAELLRMARTRRLLLVLTSRASQPAHMPESEDWEALRRMRIAGIDATATDELLDAMTREAGRYMDPEHREWCVPLAGGNPLYVQEVALQWLEKGSVREAPGSLRALIVAKLSRLSAEALLLLQTLSLMEGGAREGWLTQLGLLPKRDVVLAAHDLSTYWLVERRGESLCVRHPVIADIAVSQLETAARALLHRMLAVALESIAVQNRDALALWEATNHWTKCESASRAFESLCRCASHLVDIGLPEEAVRIYERAEVMVTGPQRVRAVCLKALALAYCDRWQSVTEVLSSDICAGQLHSADETSTLALLRLIEARWRRHLDVNPSINDAISLAQSPACGPEARLTAATLALILSDNRDGELHEYYQIKDHVGILLADPHTTESERWRHRMIFCAVQGDAVGSATAAERLIAHLDLTARPSDERFVREAAYALRYGGRVDIATAALRSAFRATKRDRNQTPKVSIAIALAICALYEHDIRQADHWYRLAVGINNACQENLIATHSLLFLQAQLGAATADTDLLIAAATSLPDLNESADNSRRQAAFVATRLRAHVARADSFSAVGNELLERCERLLAAHQHRGQMDFAVSACVRAQTLQGRVDDAARTLSAYLTDHRLERCKLHPDLNNWVSERGA